jgi:hypothetical protein
MRLTPIMPVSAQRALTIRPRAVEAEGEALNPSVDACAGRTRGRTHGKTRTQGWNGQERRRSVRVRSDRRTRGRRRADASEPSSTPSVHIWCDPVFVAHILGQSTTDQGAGNVYKRPVTAPYGHRGWG